MDDVFVTLDGKQIIFLMKITNEGNPSAALEYFATLMLDEGIDPSKMSIYIDKMMEKQGE